MIDWSTSSKPPAPTKQISDEELVKLQGVENKQIDAQRAMADPTGQEDLLLMERNRDRDNLIKWQQDLGEEMQMTIHDLKGEIQDINGDWYKPQDSEPMCNNLLIRKIVTIIRPLTSKNLMMSNYSDERILQNIRRTNTAFVFQIGGNYQNYGLKKNNMSIIVEMFKNMFEATYYRSLKAGERTSFASIHKYIKAETDGGKPTKKSLFGAA